MFGVMFSCSSIMYIVCKGVLESFVWRSETDAALNGCKIVKQLIKILNNTKIVNKNIHKIFCQRVL